MSKKDLNQNTKYTQKIIESLEYEFSFNDQPINRFKISTKNYNNNEDKYQKLSDLKQKINSIEDCKLKSNSKKLIMGDGNFNSLIMIIGEAPGAEEEISGLPFEGENGDLLKKMFIAINVKFENLYKTYAINFRPPEDRKPSSLEIKRYSNFLKEHISIINPKIIILMGATAMEAITGINTRISNERGRWQEIILKNKTYPLMITYSPSYLIRFPENKKYSWVDLKKIKQKIEDLNLKI
tara:strand:- start:206 stop:922 length:717 start_codon:yes stop_codon:yes gene_type:complete